MKVLGCLMAAGRSVRFGSAKQLALIGNKTLIETTLSVYKQVLGKQLMLVLGANYKAINAVVSDQAQTIRVKNWQDGLGTSVSEAVKQLPEDVTHVLIGLADQVAIEAEQIRLLIEQVKSTPEQIVCCQYKNTLGAPAVFPKQYFHSLEQLSGDQGAKKILEQYRHQVTPLDVKLAAVDIDTQHDLNSWIQHNS